MDFKKLTIVFAGIFSLFVFWGGTQIFNTRTTSPYSSDSLFNYIMPKLSQYIPKFSLFDRTFADHRKKLAPQLEEVAVTPAAPVKLGTFAPGAGPKTTLPIIADKQQGAIAQNGNSAIDLQNSMRDNDQVNGRDGEKEKLEGDSPTPNDGSGVTQNAPPADRNPEKQSTETQIIEWKLKLLRSPTREVMNEFVHEFEMEKISKEVFYSVMEELVKESSQDIQVVTLYGLSQVQSYDSLSFLLKHKEDYYNAGTQYKQTLAEYERPDKLKLLSMALNSGDSAVILGALPMVSKVGSKLTTWTIDQSSESGGDHRDERGPANRRPKGVIIPIIKILERLQDSKDPQVALAARDTLTEINFHPPAESSTVSLSDAKNRETEF